MFKKIRLLFNTVKYLKPTQIAHQILYRLKPSRNLDFYLNKLENSNELHFLAFEGETFPKTHVTEIGEFSFLSLKKAFDEDIDWNYQGFGKLWNYNLQYLNYLNDPYLPKEVKLAWLKDIGVWLKQGKLKLEPYPVSLRVINMIRFLSREKLTDTSLFAEIKAQINYLYRNLEYHLLGNHLLENSFALMMGGYFFDEDKWKKRAKSILYKELDEQILDDGCHFELSPMYHQIILFRVLELIDWYSKINEDEEFLRFLNKKAEKMCAFLKEITFSNGDIPHFNDSADLIALSSKELLDYAAHLKVDNSVSVELKNSGYRTFNYPNYTCIVDVGAVGPNYQPGHSHADALSFILYYKNNPLLVEQGTSTYQIGEKRNKERSTAAHNTVVVSNTNQSEVWGGFRVGKRAVVSTIEASKSKLIATHNGYLSNFGILHKREFIFSDSQIFILDEIGNSYGEANFHFHPNCESVIVKDNLVLIDTNATLSFADINLIDLRVEDYEFASGFNIYRSAKKVIVKFQNQLTSQVTFLK